LQWLPAWNGGLLNTFNNSGVTVKVAPYQGFQRLWNVSLNGRTVINSSFAQALSGQARWFAPTSSTSNSVTMEGDSGYVAWDPTVHLRMQETISQNSAGQINWAGGQKQIRASGVGYGTQIVTEYPATSQANAAAYQMQYNSGSGWVNIPLSATPTGLSNTWPTGTSISSPSATTQIRVITPDGNVQVTETYSGQYAVSLARTYQGFSYTSNPRGTASQMYVFVSIQPVTLIAPGQPGYGAFQPTFNRTIKVEPLP
jgi:hypothetical protein